MAGFAGRRARSVSGQDRAVVVESERNNPSADLLASWLHSKLKVEATQDQRRTWADCGAHDHRIGRYCYHSAGRPARLLRRARPAGTTGRPFKRRDFTDLISEELRRMDEDVVYERTVKSLLDGDKRAGRKSRAKTASNKKTGGGKANSARRVAKQAVGGARWLPAALRSCSMLDQMRLRRHWLRD